MTAIATTWPWQPPTTPGRRYYIATAGTSSVTNITTFGGGGGTQAATMLSGGGSSQWLQVPQVWPPQLLEKIEIGTELSIELPDEAMLIVEQNGSYRIEDKNAKVTYKANRVREFNTFINASDRVEDFIRYCKNFNITQREMVDLPIRLFIMWLITEAAYADEVPPEIEEVKRLNVEIKNKFHPRCKCGRFIRRSRAAQGFTFCNGDHYEKYSTRGSYHD